MGNWQHLPIGQQAKAPLSVGNPSAFAWEKDGTQHVIYLGKDSKIHELWFRHGGILGGKSTWDHNPIGEITWAPPAAGDAIGYAWEKDKTQHVVYRGTDNQIHELWCRGGKWGHNPVGQVTGAAPAASDPAGYSWENDGTQHIVYRGVDNQIHEIWYRDQWMGQDWHHSAIGQEAKAPKAAGDPAAFAWEWDKSQHVIYRGVDNQIHELWFKHGLIQSGKWEHSAIGQKAKAPIADSDPSAFAWEKDKTQHVVYRGPDNQIHELWLQHGHIQYGEWQYNPIGQRASAPRAAGNPFGYTWEYDGTVHVVFRGADNWVYELWLRHGMVFTGEWACNPIAESCGAPQASSDPVGYAWEADDTQHVIYRAADGQINELWQKR